MQPVFVELYTEGKNVVYRSDKRIRNYKLQIQNYGISLGNDKIRRRRRHLHLSFVICNYELSAQPMQR